MRRVVVLGTSGAGKTTVSRALSERLGLPHVDLDLLTADGRSLADDAFVARVEAAVAGEEWVVDGDYERALGDRVLARADTAVWLDLPLVPGLARAWTRERRRDSGPLVYRNRRGLPAWKAWIWWELRSHVRRKRAMPARLARHPHLATVRLGSRREVESWLARTAPRPGSEPAGDR